MLVMGAAPHTIFIFDKNHRSTSAMAGFGVSAVAGTPLSHPACGTVQIFDGESNGSDEKNLNENEKVSLVGCCVFWSLRQRNARQ